MNDPRQTPPPGSENAQPVGPNSDVLHALADPVASRRRWLWGAVATGAALAGASAAWWRHGRAQRELQQAPTPPSADLQAGLWSREWPTPSGQSLAVSSLQGKPLLLNFWATWCPPCVEELPLLDAFYAQHRTSGWQALAVAIDKMPSVRSFLDKHPLKLTVAVLDAGEGMGLMRTLGNGMQSLPFTVVLNPTGDIAYRKLGAVKPDELSQVAGLHPHWR